MSVADDEKPSEATASVLDGLVEEERPVWHRDPKIKPNYGPKKQLLPKSHLKKVS